MEDQKPLRNKLEELRAAHSNLDDLILRLSGSLPFDQLKLQRLKRQKLELKDQMVQLESLLVPDIIA